MTLKKSDIAAAAAEADDTAFTLGETLLLKTATDFFIGRLTRISTLGAETYLHLSDPSWLAESERWHVTIETGAVREIEPTTKPIRVNTRWIVSVYPWDHALPRVPK